MNASASEYLNFVDSKSKISSEINMIQPSQQNLQSSTPRGFFTGEDDNNMLSEIGFAASNNCAGLESRPLQQQQQVLPDDSDSSRDNSVVTPMQFIKVYGLHESFIMDNAVNMFGQEINLSKTGLE